MGKGIIKLAVRCFFLFFLFNSCKEEHSDIEAYEIDKAIELVHTNKSINDTLLKFRQKLGVEFMPCIIITNDKYRILGFQIVQSNSEKNPPLKIDSLFKIEKIQGVDVLFVSTEKDFEKGYDIKIDNKVKELMKKGYLTVTGNTSIIDSPFIKFVFCKNDDSVFQILSSDFLNDKEMKARSRKVPFIIENYYPKCN